MMHPHTLFLTRRPDATAAALDRLCYRLEERLSGVIANIEQTSSDFLRLPSIDFQARPSGVLQGTEKKSKEFPRASSSDSIPSLSLHNLQSDVFVLERASPQFLLCAPSVPSNSLNTNPTNPFVKGKHVCTTYVTQHITRRDESMFIS